MNHPSAPHHHVKHHEVHHQHPAHKSEAKSHEAELYVAIMEPVTVRKPMLEAARIAISAGRVQAELHRIQDEKLLLRSELVTVIKDIHHEITRLQMVLPYRDVKEIQPLAPPKAKPIEHKVDKIAEALAEIEARMKSL
jgi:hypothetical protein